MKLLAERLKPYRHTLRRRRRFLLQRLSHSVDTVLQNLGVAFTTVATIRGTGRGVYVVGGIVMTVMGTSPESFRPRSAPVIGVCRYLYSNWQMAANGAQTVFQGMSTTVTSIVNGLVLLLLHYQRNLRNIPGSLTVSRLTVGNIFHGI